MDRYLRCCGFFDGGLMMMMMMGWLERKRWLEMFCCCRLACDAVSRG